MCVVVARSLTIWCLFLVQDVTEQGEPSGARERYVASQRVGAKGREAPRLGRYKGLRFDERRQKTAACAACVAVELA